MKKKELFNRLTAVSMAAMMTVTMLPANAFASEIDFADDGQEVTAEVEAEDDSSQKADAADIDETEVADEATDEISIAEDNEEVSADEDYEDFSDEMEAAGAETDDAADDTTLSDEQKALNAAYIENKDAKYFNNPAATKSEDGLTYTVALKNPTNNSSVNAVAFNNTSISGYTFGVYTDTEYSSWIKLVGTSRVRILERPAYADGAKTVKILLALYKIAGDKPASGSDIATAKKKAAGYLEFNLVIQPEDPAYTMAFKVQDSKTKEEITDAAITFKKGYSTVSPTDSVYKVENGSSYTVTVKKDGYNDYTETFTFTGDPKNINSTKVINLKPIIYRNITFKVVDENTNEEIPGAAEKLQVKKDYYTTLKAENDGTYKLVEDTEYKYSVSGVKNYKDISNVAFTVTENDPNTITIPMEVEISEFKVTIKPVDGDKEITPSSCRVYYIDDDYYDETEEDVTAENGVYTLNKGTKYFYEITAEGYKKATGSFTPSGKEVNLTIPVRMIADVEVSEEDQQKVDAVKKIFDAELGVLRPMYLTDKNVADTVKRRFATSAYENVDTTGIEVYILSSDDYSAINLDGNIHYRAKKMDSGVNVTNLDTTLLFKLNNATATVNRRFSVGWDYDYFNNQMKAETEKLTWDTIKGSNEAAEKVTDELNLPQYLSSSARTAWSKLTWKSSDPEVITFEGTKGVINPRPDDTEVTLTATFKANDILLNGYTEKVEDFATYTKEFKITVEGSHIAPPTEEELKTILEKYYTADSITDFVTGKTADLNNCQSDLQLPRYTKIKDADGNLVFNNKEITVTSENKAISINDYRTFTDVFYDKDITGDLVVTFTRQGVSAEKRISVTVKPLSEEALDAEVAMMEQAKLHYFDGINNNANTDKNTIINDLHAFKEMTLDAAGEPVWVYNVDNIKRTGIIVDDMFDDSWIMEGAGFNKFKSSNQAVITHDNLLVHRRETDEEITISSVLSSERYGVFAKNHPENAKLQKLYKQPVSVTVTVKGTKAPAEGLADLITSTEKLLGEIKEGKEPGQYPEGTKDKLQAALTAAKKVQAKEDATDAEREQAIKALKAAVKEAEASQNVVVADVTVRVNQASGQLPMVKKLSVKATTAESYGYVKPEEMKNKVTAADAFYAMNAAVYGEDFVKEHEKYLSISENGWVNVMFGKPAGYSGYYVNNVTPVDENGTYTVANNTVLKSGDELSFFFYSDTKNWSDKYLYFKDMPAKAEAKVAFNVTLFANGYPTDTAVEGAKVALKNTATGAITEAKTNAKGVATLKADQAGTYQIYVSEAPYKYYIVPSADITVAAHTHSYTWKTVSKATVFQPEKQEGACSVCGEKTTRTVGNKLTATIKLNAKSIKLQKKQTTKKIKVTMANGDYVKSWKSSNKKIVTVNKNGVIKAGKKTGKAKITVTLASGKKATLKVKVQKAKVTTTKITGLKSKVTIKKGEKLALKANLKPLTTQNKVTYKSSNKKVATVNKKGVITAKKKGTVKITVKSGKKTKVIKVTVK